MKWLFDTSDFNSKQACGIGWTTELLWTYGASNAIAWLVYSIFPLLVLIYLYPRHLKSVRPALRAFA